MFVLVVDLDTGNTEYRAFTKKRDAEDIYEKSEASAYSRKAKPVTITRTGEKAWVMEARLYEVNADDPRSAVEIVQSGGGVLIRPDPTLENL